MASDTVDEKGAGEGRAILYRSLRSLHPDSETEAMIARAEADDELSNSTPGVGVDRQRSGRTRFRGN